MRPAQLYLAVAGSSFRRYSTYRAATAAGIFTNTVFGFILTFTFIALWSQRPQLGGYDQAQALTFVWTGQALLAAAALLGGGFEDELLKRIRSGDITIDLYRPVDLQLWWLATDLGRAAFQLLARGILPMVTGALAFRLALPANPLTWLLFLLSVTLGVIVGFAIRYLATLTAFWLLDAAGVTAISGLLGIFFSGMLLPLTVFPGQFGEIVRWLPWSAVLQIPADILIGAHHGTGVARALAFQATWALLLLAAGRAVQSAATRKVVVQGG